MPASLFLWRQAGGAAAAAASPDHPGNRRGPVFDANARDALLRSRHVTADRASEGFGPRRPIPIEVLEKKRAGATSDP